MEHLGGLLEVPLAVAFGAQLLPQLPQLLLHDTVQSLLSDLLAAIQGHAVVQPLPDLHHLVMVVKDLVIQIYIVIIDPTHRLDGMR